MIIIVVFSCQALLISANCICKSSVQLENESCVCHHGNYCLPYWDQWESSADADRSSADVVFYPCININGKSCVNATVTLKNSDIKRLVFLYPESCFYDKRNRCRAYDFSNTSNLPVNTEFYSDHVYFDNEVNDLACHVGVIGLSKQATTLYYSEFLFKIPNHHDLMVELAKNITLKQWKSFIVLETSHQYKSVLVTFTTAPEQFNASFYKMRIVSDDVSNSWKEIRNTGDPVIRQKLENLFSGINYTVQISAVGGVISSSACFKFTEEDVTWLKIVCGVLGTILLAVVTIVLWMSISHALVVKRLREGSAKTVKIFLVYSHDIKEHVDVMQFLAKYLQTYCHCNVLIDISNLRNNDPHFWVSESIDQADYILIIWSRGARLKVMKNNCKILKNEPGYLGEDLFSNAITKISAKIAQELRIPYYRRNLNKFINISLSYAPKDCVPSEFDYLRHYHLPTEFNALLCCMHGYGPAQLSLSPLPSRVCMPCFKCYPSLPFSQLKAYPEGKKLLMAIDEMHKVEKAGDWLPSQLKNFEPAIDQYSSSEMLSNSEQEMNKRQSLTATFGDNADDYSYRKNNLCNNCQDTDSKKNCLLDMEADLPDEIFGPYCTPTEVHKENCHSDDLYVDLPEEIFGPHGNHI